MGYLAHILRGGEPLGQLIVGQLKLTENKVVIAALGYFAGVFQCVRHIGKELLHFLGAFKIELLGFKAHTVGVCQCFSGLYAKQDIVRGGVLAVYIVSVVCADKRNIQLAGKLYKQGIYRVLRGKAVILKLNIEPSGKHGGQALGQSLGAVPVSAQEQLRDIAAYAGGGADKREGKS